MRTEKAKKKIEDAGGDWLVFIDWMANQTVGLYDDGETDWYECDVNRFIIYKCNRNESFNN